MPPCGKIVRDQLRRLAVLLVVLVAACSSIAQRMDRHLQAREWDEAISLGEKWIDAQNPAKVDPGESQKVRHLLAEARLGRAKKIDTVDAYGEVVEAYPAGEPRDIVAEAKKRLTATWYRDYTTKRGKVDDYRVFRAKFPEAAEVAASKAAEAAVALADLGPTPTVAALDQWRESYEAWPEAAKSASQARSTEVDLVVAEARRIDTLAAWRGVSAKLAGWAEATNALPEARKREVELAFAEADRAEGVDMLRAFVDRYWGWLEARAQVQLAREHIRVKRLAAALAAGDEGAALREFIEHYRADPDAAVQVDEARSRLAERLWASARASLDVGKLKTIVAEFPEAPQAASAASLLASIQAYNASPGRNEWTVEMGAMSRTATGTVRAFVQVLGPDGAPVGGLRRDHFQVLLPSGSLPIAGFAGTDEMRPLDMVLVFDVTGSMSVQIDAAKAAALEFAAGLRLRNRDARFGVVTFGDTVQRVFAPLTPDIETLRGWLGSMTSGGGDDTPENPLDAMAVAVGLKFRPNAQVALILITDAPAHVADRVTTRTFEQLTSQLSSRSITLFAVGPNWPPYREMTAKLGGQLFPIGDAAAFESAFLQLGTLTAKQYEIAFADPAESVDPAMAATVAKYRPRVRAFRDISWATAGSAPPGEFAIMVEDSTISAAWMAAAVGGGLFYSSDGAKTWRPAGKPTVQTLLNVGPHSWLLLDDTGRIQRSGGDGAQWTTADSAPAACVAIAQDFARPSHLWAATASSISESQDGGLTWSTAAAAGGAESAIVKAWSAPGGRFLYLRADASAWEWTGPQSRSRRSAFQLPPLVAGHRARFVVPWWNGHVVLVLGEDGRLWRSGNGGATWVELTIARAGGRTHLRYVVADRANLRRLVAIGDDGLWLSDDAGLTWRLAGEGLLAADLQRSSVALSSRGGLLLASAQSKRVVRPAAVVDREFVASHVYFPTGSHRINDELRAYLLKLADRIRGRLHLSVRIDGHTDDVGEEGANMTLSLQRAEAVRAALVEAGIDSRRVEVQGWGETRPLVPNTNSEARARNRRVEIAVLEAE